MSTPRSQQRRPKKAPPSELPLLQLWEHTLHTLLDTTERFPKRVRYSFVARIDGAGLELLEHLTLARYAPAAEVSEHLKRADQCLNKLRVLLRLSAGRALIQAKDYPALIEALDEVGQMLGAWLKSASTRALASANPTR